MMLNMVSHRVGCLSRYCLILSWLTSFLNLRMLTLLLRRWHCCLLLRTKYIISEPQSIDKNIFDWCKNSNLLLTMNLLVTIYKKLASKVMQKRWKIINYQKILLLYIIVSFLPILWPRSHHSNLHNSKF